MTDEYDFPIMDAEVPLVLCCQCGVAIKPNPISTCVDCLQNRYDIGAGVAKQVQQHTCRGCHRFERRDGGWTACEPESKELLALLLKKPRGLAQVRLVDASFVWTEPHSKRIKLRVCIQKEVITGAVLQQTFIIEFVIGNKQCPHCQRREAKDTWVAMTQVRQKVPHKRTFLWIEQLILRHSAHSDATNIIEAKDGLDFFFDERSHAEKLVSFLQSVCPARYKASNADQSIDTHTGKCKTKFTYALEILPVCKDDLVWLPRPTAHSLGQFAQLGFCSKVSNVVHLVDPQTIQQAELQPVAYWKAPFKPVLSRGDLVEFVVLDVELRDPEWATRGRKHGVRQGREARALADVTVARRSDFGQSDRTVTTLTHLGNILKEGDYAWGYMVAASPLAAELEEHQARQLPEVLLVKKSYSERRRRMGGKKLRLCKLRQLEKEKEAGVQRGRKMDTAEHDREYEDFLQELEEDPALRAQISLYKDHDAIDARQARAAARAAEARRGQGITAGSVFAASSAHAGAEMGEASSVTAPGAMGGHGSSTGGVGAPAGLHGDEGYDEDDEDEDDDDFPDVKLEELLDELTLGTDDPEGDGEATEASPPEVGPVTFAAALAPQANILPPEPPVQRAKPFELPSGPNAKFNFL